MESEHESVENSQTISKTSTQDEQSIAANEPEPVTEEAAEETLVERLNLLRSNNPYRQQDERVHAVRQNIKEKFEHTAKTAIEEAEESKPQIEKRLEHCDKEMADLLAFGNEIITNIKVNNERRELLRREFESQQRNDLENAISKETTEAMARYNDIVSCWSELGELEEPIIIFAKLTEQKDRVIELMRSKDDMIAKCQQEIDRINERYEAEQYKQQTDVASTVERVNAQMSLLKEAYSHQLNLLEDTLESERQTIAIKEQEKWKNFYKTAQEYEKYKPGLQKEKNQFYTNEIQRITTQQEEITRSTRIRLEKESEMLLYELRCTKNRVLMNSEKLDYNCQVLQKRNEENVIINNQQKRRVGKITETLVDLKKRIKSAQTNGEHTIVKLTNEIQKLHDSITDLEKKCETIRLRNRSQLLSVWDTNFQEVKALIDRVFEIDRILHEQQLGVPWRKPLLNLDEFELVKKEKSTLLGGLDSHSLDSNYSKSSESMQQINEIGKSATLGAISPLQHHRDTLMRKAEAERKLREQQLEKRLLRNIMRKVADHGGFLVEDRLLESLRPYTEHQKTLVRIDNIFAALGITDMAGIKRLVEFFKPYTWCPNCTKGIPREQLKKLYRPCLTPQIPCREDDDDDFNSQQTRSFESALESSSTNKANSLIREIHAQSQSAATAQDKKCDNHYLLVESAMVLTALNEFTNQQAKNFDEESKRHHTLRASKTISGGSSRARSKPSVFSSYEINDEVICEYWRKFQDYMPKEKLKLWHTLEHGLQHYLKVLKQREQLDKDCAALRQQNSELKHLLQKFNV